MRKNKYMRHIAGIRKCLAIGLTAAMCMAMLAGCSTSQSTSSTSDTEVTSDGMVANWLFNNGNGNTKTFVSLAGKSFEAEAANIVSSWKTDPILETSAPTE